jgi:hypothetical protein
VLDSLTWHVMDATADDWESLDQILPYVRETHGSVEALAVAEVIARLLGEGLMEEMQHASVSPPAVVSNPIEFWFRMTPGGRTIWDVEGERWRAFWDARQRALDEADDAFYEPADVKPRD